MTKPTHSKRAGLLIVCSDGAYIDTALRNVLTIWGLNGMWRRIRRACRILLGMTTPFDERIDIVAVPGSMARPWNDIKMFIEELLSLHTFTQNRVAVVIHRNCGKVPDDSDRRQNAQAAVYLLRALAPHLVVTFIEVDLNGYDMVPIRSELVE